jgi:maleamate amidohydrolase
MLIDTDQFVVRRITEQDRLPPDMTALIMVDMMRRFCDPQWLAGGNVTAAQWFGAELEGIIPNLRRLLHRFRETGALVVHVVNAKWTVEGRDVVPYQRGRDYDLFDTPAMSVVDALAPRPGEIVVRKVASSAFTGTGLEFLLRNAGIEHVVLTGQYGSACVFYTLIQSRELGFSNYWVEDAILYGSARDKALFAPLVGSRWARLASVDEIKRALTREAATV